MRIIMLGHTGVGKTTYMASLYGSMQQSIEGFRLKAVEPEHHKRWIELAEQIQQGKYPTLTDQRQEYNFYLRYQGKNILQFAWADYRGGAILETQKSDQTKALVQDLKTADGIMLFCDCDALAQGDSRSNQIGRMTTLASQALRELNRPMSLAIVLTKTDLVMDFQVDLLQSLNGLIAAINANDFVWGALLPIACGQQLRNVPMPLLFVLHAAVVFQATTIYAGVESHTELAKSYEAQSRGFIGMADWVIAKLNKQETYQEMAAKEKQQALKKQQELQEIIEPAKSLYNYVQKLPLIKPGLNLNDYARLLSENKGGLIENAENKLDIWII
ncbi:TRAFAC clade GTPase domain-containing protein [Nostoc sp. 2RC]|uniref:TRAFAC clade GTPase domain-containing protein n=1 Tax=Nostoc sp. 2RC TaxID=2485484 RepID=UPI0016274433|nr:GTPase domain-containing protein [Nostoc sp. 2RC]MBC1238346.1 GTPase domain-containing protein [Nostoc sp. 2RC]